MRLPHEICVLEGQRNFDLFNRLIAGIVKLTLTNLLLLPLYAILKRLSSPQT